MTVAPKIKLGDDVPSYAGRPALGRHELLNFDLVESHAIGNGIFVRYRKR